MTLVMAMVCLLMTSAVSRGQAGNGSQTVTTGLPIGPSPDAGGNPMMIDVWYTDAMGMLKKKTVSVPNIPACQGLPYPTPDQVAAASAAKAAAIAKAINDAKIPGVMAAVPMATVGVPYTVSRVLRAGPGSLPTLVSVSRIAQASQVTVTGVSPSPNRNGTPGQPIMQTPGNTVTGEVGDSRQPFQQGNTPSPGTRMSYNGGGSGEMATAMDVAGNQSEVEFGFIDFSGPTPVDYTESMGPALGMTDGDILSTLALWFNQDYSADGFTATYDPTADSLSIDQILPPTDWLFEGNSDTGMDFSSEMDFVPEPGSALFAGAALVGALVRRKRPLH